MVLICKTMFLSLCLIFMVQGFLCAESENYCHDEKSWEEWEALIEKNPNDMEIQALHALRIGLCAKVDRGQITLEQATSIFESARRGYHTKTQRGSKKGAG